MNSKIDSLRLPILTLTFRVVLGIVFIYASLDKIQYPADFAIAVQNYRLIPDVLTNLVAIILPWVELVCGICLFVGFFLRESASIISSLIIVFIIVLVSALIRGLDINCGCYGMETQISWGRILEDIGLLFMAAYITFFPGSQLSIDHIINKNRCAA